MCSRISLVQETADSIDEVFRSQVPKTETELAIRKLKSIGESLSYSIENYPEKTINYSISSTPLITGLWVKKTILRPSKPPCDLVHHIAGKFQRP